MIVHDDPQGSEYHDMYPKSECYVKVQQVLEEFKDQDLDDDERGRKISKWVELY